MCEGRPTQRASPRYWSPRRELSTPTTPIRLEGEAVEEEEEEEGVDKIEDIVEVGTNEIIHHQETDETTCHHQTKISNY